MITIEPTDILHHTKAKDFDVLRIEHHFNIALIQEMTTKILADHTLIMKDHYDTYQGIGMQYHDPDNKLYDCVEQTAFIDNKAMAKLREFHNFLTLNEIGEQFSFIYNTMERFNIILNRGRILAARPGHVHSEHKDNDIRIHLPVFTNQDCWMIYGEDAYHMPADGSMYLINGFRLHRFYNKGTMDRIHMVWLVK